MSKQKLAIVTGASGTLGIAIVDALKQEHWRVIGFDIEPSDHCETMSVDIANIEDLQTCLDIVGERYGPASALINNAGVFGGIAWDGINEANFNATFAVNLRGPILLSTMFARKCIEGGLESSIVNVTSIAGREPGHDIVYAASKAALIHATRGLGRQLAPYGIRVNAVAPGVIEGPMAERIPEPARSQYLERTPMHRFGKSWEIAGLVSFLLSPAASYMTGAIVDVNGGLY